jgi:hypothetical protein
LPPSYRCKIIGDFQIIGACRLLRYVSMIICPSIILYYPHSNNWGLLCKKLRHWPTILVCSPPDLEIPNRLTNGSHLASKTGQTSANFISSHIHSLHLQQIGVKFCYSELRNRKGNQETRKPSAII